MALQVKLYIQPEQEIRRFVLDTNANFATLFEKAKELVGRDNIRLFWQDSEGDQIVLGSDFELAAARQTIDANGLLRIHANTVKGAAGPVDEKRVHRRVTCDGCQGPIAGTRYKCIECPDYDLCEGCEAKGTHSDHDMLAIRKPKSDWKKFFGHGHGHRHGHHGHGEEGPRRCGAEQERADAPPCGPGPFPFGGPGRFAGAGPFGGPFGAGQGPFAAGHGPFGAGGPGPFGPGPKGPCGRRRGPGPCGGMPPFMRAGLGNLMQNLGQTVEMDIDMTKPFPEIITEITKKVQEAVQKNQAAAAAPAQENTEENKDGQPEATTANDEVAAQATAVAEAVNVVADMINQQFASGSQTPSEADGWTHLQPEQPEQPQPTTAEVKKEEAEQQPTGNRIEAALKAMGEIGFPNEGNLLRRLLENYNGDIARVLDSIK